MGLRDLVRAVLGVCATRALDEAYWQTGPDEVVVSLAGAPELAQPGGGVYLAGQGLKRPILVFKDEEGLIRAVINRCTHGGRKLDPWEGGRTLRCCSVNHSRFDCQGNKLSGPAKGGLTMLEVQERQGELLVTGMDS